jgi:hypothetical protein
MGAMFALAPCVGCGSTFTFNPDKVPSVVVRGIREPICQVCVDAANPTRVANGLDPIEVLPGAYDAEECP